MRKNVKKQLALRVLSTAALMAMVSSIATAAFADTYDLNKGSVTVETKENGITYVTQENTEINDHQDDTGVTITSYGKQTENTITVDTAKDQTTDVTLQDVHIETEGSWNNTGSAPIEIKGDGDTNLELNGDNTVLSGDRHHAAIEKADKNGHGTLTIKDDLNDDNSTPKDKDENGNAAGGDTGKLLAGGYGDGAGIGGGYNGITDQSYADTSNITIKGGEITARGGCEDGAGIGGGTYGKAKTSALKAMLTSRQAEMAVQALAAVSKETMSLLPETPLSMPIANMVPPSAMAVRGEAAIRPSRSPATPRSMPRAKMQQRQSVPAKMAIREILRSQLQKMPM